MTYLVVPDLILVRNYPLENGEDKREVKGSDAVSVLQAGPDSVTNGGGDPRTHSLGKGAGGKGERAGRWEMGPKQQQRSEEEREFTK